jgi:putative endonuclease
MHFFYVLYSFKDHKLYKGTTSDIAKRFSRHNSGGNKSTAHRKPFALIYLESFNSRKEALEAERFYKSLLGGAQLKALLIEKSIFNEDGKFN